MYRELSEAFCHLQDACGLHNLPVPDEVIIRYKEPRHAYDFVSTLRLDIPTAAARLTQTPGEFKLIGIPVKLEVKRCT